MSSDPTVNPTCHPTVYPSESPSICPTLPPSAIPSSTASPTGNVLQYGYTGGVQYFYVPSWVNSITVTAFGASGGYAYSNPPGFGGRIKSTVSVTPSSVLYIYVGGSGVGPSGGFNGGGSCEGSQPSGAGGGGGGATDIRTVQDVFSSVLVVAGNASWHFYKKNDVDNN